MAEPIHMAAGARPVDWDDHAVWGLSEESIRDKSNADSTAKLSTLVQVTWFMAQSIMRRAHTLPLSQLESMTLSYIPLFAVTYFYWWVKPKDVLTPSVVDLPDMLPGQKTTFESMAVSSAFDDGGIGKQDTLWPIWYLTPRVFEKEAEDKALQEAQQKALQKAKQWAPQEVKQVVVRENGDVESLKENNPTPLATAVKNPTKEIVLGHWNPEVYHSKTLWPIICLFGVSFGVLHFICWNTEFPTPAELWLWRAASISSVVTMLVFMQFEKVIFRWGGPLTMISLVSPALCLLSRIVMIVGVFAALRASDPAIYQTYVVSTYWVHIL